MQNNFGQGGFNQSRKRPVNNQGGANPPKRGQNMPSSGLFSEGLIDISMITPYINKFRFCGIVTFKEAARKINTKRGQMDVFSFNIADSSGSSIKVTAFGTDCERFADFVQDGQAYYISCMGTNMVRETNKRYNSTGHAYELTLNGQSTVELCTDRAVEAPQCVLKAIPLIDIKNHPNECIDVLAIIDKADEIGTVTAKATQKDLKRRNFVLVDDGCVQIQFTLWEDDVDKVNDEMIGQVVGIKGVSVREFNGGFTLGFAPGGAFIHAPDSARVSALLEWYQDKRPSAEIGSLTVALGGGGSFERDCRTIHAVNSLDLTGVGKSAYVTIEGFINSFSMEKISYNACSIGSCRKKVTQQGSQWNCDTCGISDTCRPMYILGAEVADFTGHTWITLFDEVATTLLGRNASEMLDLKGGDRETYNSVFDNLRCKRFEFRVQLRSEVYNNQTRPRLTCYKVSSPNVVSYLKVLEKSLEELSATQ